MPRAGASGRKTRAGRPEVGGVARRSQSGRKALSKGRDLTGLGSLETDLGRAEAAGRPPVLVTVPDATGGSPPGSHRCQRICEATEIQLGNPKDQIGCIERFMKQVAPLWPI